MHSSTHRASAAEPFFLSGGSIGILIVHGYGGSLGDYRPIADDLQQRGYAVRGVCLAGHGQGREVLRTTTVDEMYDSVMAGYRELQHHCSSVIILGSSFGATLALAVAERHRDVDGIVVVNPAISYRGGGSLQGLLLRLLRLWTPYYPKRGLTKEERQRAKDVGSTDVWPINGILATSKFAKDIVVPSLTAITCPTLLLASSDDPVVGTDNNATVLSSIRAERKDQQTIPIATHRPFRDPAASQFIAQAIDTFIRQNIVSEE